MKQTINTKSEYLNMASDKPELYYHLLELTGNDVNKLDFFKPKKEKNRGKDIKGAPLPKRTKRVRIYDHPRRGNIATDWSVPPNREQFKTDDEYYRAVTSYVQYLLDSYVQIQLYKDTVVEIIKAVSDLYRVLVKYSGDSVVAPSKYKDAKAALEKGTALLRDAVRSDSSEAGSFKYLQNVRYPVIVDKLKKYDLYNKAKEMVAAKRSELQSKIKGFQEETFDDLKQVIEYATHKYNDDDKVVWLRRLESLIPLLQANKRAYNIVVSAAQMLNKRYSGINLDTALEYYSIAFSDIDELRHDFVDLALKEHLDEAASVLNELKLIDDENEEEEEPEPEEKPETPSEAQEPEESNEQPQEEPKQPDDNQKQPEQNIDDNFVATATAIAARDWSLGKPKDISREEAAKEIGVAGAANEIQPPASFLNAARQKAKQLWIDETPPELRYDVFNIPEDSNIDVNNLTVDDIKDSELPPKYNEYIHRAIDAYQKAHADELNEQNSKLVDKYLEIRNAVYDEYNKLRDKYNSDIMWLKSGECHISDTEAAKRIGLNPDKLSAEDRKKVWQFLDERQRECRRVNDEIQSLYRKLYVDTRKGKGVDMSDTTDTINKLYADIVLQLEKTINDGRELYLNVKELYDMFPTVKDDAISKAVDFLNTLEGLHIIFDSINKSFGKVIDPLLMDAGSMLDFSEYAKALKVSVEDEKPKEVLSEASHSDHGNEIAGNPDNILHTDNEYEVVTGGKSTKQTTEETKKSEFDDMEVFTGKDGKMYFKCKRCGGIFRNKKEFLAHVPNCNTAEKDVTPASDAAGGGIGNKPNSGAGKQFVENTNTGYSG